jgi:hypothetical protein
VGIGRPGRTSAPVNIQPSLLAWPHLKLFREAAKASIELPAMRPLRPHDRKGWPEEAVADWAAWGKRNPPRFFAKWPELRP